MTQLQPNETDLLGRWIYKDGKMDADDVCARIDSLTTNCLRKVAGGGWETLYQDPADGRYWERTYPQSALHSGGPPRLTYLSQQQADAKYKLPQSLSEALSPAEVEIIRRALQATVEGSFFPDWEFETLFGVDRITVREVYEAWPRQSVGRDEFLCAVVGSMNNLVGYPHGKDHELGKYLSEGRTAIEAALQRVTSLGL